MLLQNLEVSCILRNKFHLTKEGWPNCYDFDLVGGRETGFVEIDLGWEMVVVTVVVLVVVIVVVMVVVIVVVVVVVLVVIVVVLVVMVVAVNL